MREALNGNLKDLDAKRLMDEVKERRCSLFTERRFGDYNYSISIHPENPFARLDDNTEYFIDIIEEDQNEEQRRLTTYKSHSHLKDYEVVEKIESFIKFICC